MSRLGFGSLAIVLALGLSACGGGGTEKGSPAATPGVTKEPCPQAIDKTRGCIYLGIISDLSTGPFHALGIPTTKAQQAFWRRVNQQGGIGGHEIDVTKYVADNKYTADLHKQGYYGMKDKVLALAQTFGSPTTAQILADLRASKIVAAPASWTSAWEFEDVILESGSSYCFESMNALDYAVEAWKSKSAMAVHYAGDYGDDSAAGARVAATRLKLPFTDALITPTRTTKVIADILRLKPAVVMLATSPLDAATIIGLTARGGFKGRFIGSSPSWDKALLTSKDTITVAAIKRQYVQATFWKPFASDSPGHTAMRKALGDVPPDDAFTSGWVWSYPLKAVLQKAAANHELTRAGLLKAVKQVTRIDYEGILPAAAGDFSGDPDQAAFRGTVFTEPDQSQLTGVRVAKDFFTGPTAKSYLLDSPCTAKP